jgi:hypothetical protein
MLLKSQPISDSEASRREAGWIIPWARAKYSPQGITTVANPTFEDVLA